MSNELDPEVLRSFLDEAHSYIPALWYELNRLRESPENKAALEELYRLTHSIRGAGEMIRMPELTETARGLEELLESGTPCDSSLLELLTAGLVQLEQSLGANPNDKPAEIDNEPEEIAADLLESFLEEAGEHLQAVGERLRQVEHHKDRRAFLREIRRGVHTIKGAAGMVGLRDTHRVAHRMEDVLDLLYEEQAPHTPQCQQLLMATYDLLCDIVSARGSASRFRGRIDQILSQYDGLSLEGVQTAPQNEVVPVPETTPTQIEAADPATFVRVPLQHLDELVRLVGELFVNSSVFEQHLAAYSRELDEMNLSLARMRRIAGSMETRHATFTAGLAGAPENYSRRGEFDELEFDRYTQLHLLSRDLTEASSDLAAVGGQLRLTMSGFDGFLSQQGRLGGELQDKMMRLRMVPLSTIANRLHRTVRVSAQKCGKTAELVLDGLSTELDKTVMEQLAGPLEHLLRNAVDHGIESPSVRQAAGKPKSGAIRLSAAYEGTQVVLRLSDDGAGLDLEKIRKVASRLGYHSDGEADGLDEQRLYNLIFEPGFSTAEWVGDISGRGIGLDVVKAGVESLKGMLSLNSTPGKGVTFTVRLPMTLAITKVLMVEAQQERFAIPLAAVTQAARVDEKQLEMAAQRPMIRLEHKLLPVTYLSELLNLRGPVEPPKGRLPVVVVHTGESELALIVDRIVEAREVVVKPLAGLLRQVPRMIGATLLGDGSVVLILNPTEMTVARPQQSQPGPRKRPTQTPNSFEILIVDDSPSVRRAVANLVRNTGWVPMQAKDGMEALEILQRAERRPDAILMDIEMPRMDGFELTSTLRSQPAYRNTPVIMLTSRAGEKHRRKALDAGANEYLVKPYQDDALLEVVRHCVEHYRKGSQVA